MIIDLSPQVLKAHPINSKIYGDLDIGDLYDSVLENGVLVPLVVTDDYTIISGTRRWQVARQLGLETVPCEIRTFKTKNDEVLAIIDYNKYRVKNPQQIYNESQEVKRIYSAQGIENQEATQIKDGKPPTDTPKSEEPRSSRESDSRTAKDFRMGKTKFRQIEEIFDKKKIFPDIAEKVAKEEISVNKGYEQLKKREARKRLTENPPEDSDELTLFKHLEYPPKPWDVWNYKRDKLYGVEYPGSIPAGIVFNTIYFYTEPRNLVVDPMAGGGVVGDVCKVTKRECLMFDIQPSRDDITQHDLNNGFPVKDADLVFLDPPYYKKKEKDYGEKSISSLDRKEYLLFFDKLAHDIHNSRAKKIAFLMSDYTDDEEVSKHIFIWEYVKMFEAAGWIPIRHIMAPIATTAIHPDFVVKFRKSKKLGRLGRSLVIFRRK